MIFKNTKIRKSNSDTQLEQSDEINHESKVQKVIADSLFATSAHLEDFAQDFNYEDTLEVIFAKLQDCTTVRKRIQELAEEISKIPSVAIVKLCVQEIRKIDVRYIDQMEIVDEKKSEVERKIETMYDNACFTVVSNSTRI